MRFHLYRFSTVGGIAVVHMLSVALLLMLLEGSRVSLYIDIPDFLEPAGSFALYVLLFPFGLWGAALIPGLRVSPDSTFMPAFAIGAFWVILQSYLWGFVISLIRARLRRTPPDEATE